MTQSPVSAPGDTGERRRAVDAPPALAELIDEATVQGIVEEAWFALVGDDEFLMPMPGGVPDDAVSSWVHVAGPWTGTVVLTCGRSTAEELAACLLREHAPPIIDDEDVADALGELANVVGGNIKAVLPGPSALSLPEVGSPPPAGADTCRVDLLWRGQSLSISVQSPAGALLDPHENYENEVSL